jgi:hypothetical protein
MQWKAPISDYLPAFGTPYNPDVSHNAKLADILSQLTRLAPLLYGILGKNDSILTRCEDVLHTSANYFVLLHYVPSSDTTIGATPLRLVWWTKKAKPRGPLVCTRLHII